MNWKYLGPLVVCGALALLAASHWFWHASLDQEAGDSSPATERGVADLSEEAATPVGVTGTPEGARAAANDNVLDDAFEDVMGLSVLRDRNCVVRRHYIEQADGSLVEAYSCEPISESIDSYDHYSDDALAELAYSDSNAAYALGRRWINLPDKEDEATTLLLRAVALDEQNIEGIQVIVRQRFWDQFSEDSGVDMRKKAYVFNSLAATLDSAYDFRRLGSLARLEEAGIDEEAIAGLDRERDALLRKLVEIQIEVVGESRIARRVGS